MMSSYQESLTRHTKRPTHNLKRQGKIRERHSRDVEMIRVGICLSNAKGLSWIEDMQEQLDNVRGEVESLRKNQKEEMLEIYTQTHKYTKKTVT